jgi:hypothetical protein
MNCRAELGVKKLLIGLISVLALFAVAGPSSVLAGNTSGAGVGATSSGTGVGVVQAEGSPANHWPQATPRIVGGEETSIEDWPWQVEFSFNPSLYGGDGFERHQCGGSLVTPTLVVSAAHCFFEGSAFEDPGKYAAVTGRTQLTSDIGQETEIFNIYYPTDSFGDPLYDPATDEWDVVLVELATSSDSETIKLAGPDELALWGKGRIAFATGWGATSEGGPGSDILREVRIEMISDSVCDLSFGGFFAQSMVCAGLMQGGKDACQGDSGGPLVVPTSAGEFRLVGATSTGDGCARPGSPGIYTRVSGESIRAWLADSVQSLAGVDIVGSGAEPLMGPTSIGRVSVTGPTRVKRGRSYTFRASVTNTGNFDATGTRLVVSGRGIRFNGLIGSIAPRVTRNVRFQLRPSRTGRIRFSFRIQPDNASGRSVIRTITVRR